MFTGLQVEHSTGQPSILLAFLPTLILHVQRLGPDLYVEPRYTDVEPFCRSMPHTAIVACQLQGQWFGPVD